MMATESSELQDMFKAVLRGIRPASLYEIRDVVTGRSRDYLLGRDGLLDENDHIECAH